MADRLPQVLAADVLEPAREAFTQALQVAATVSGVLVIAAAAMVARLLRSGDERRPSEETGAPVVAPATQGPCA